MTLVELKGILSENNYKMIIESEYDSKKNVYGILKLTPVKQNIEKAVIHYTENNDNKITMSSFLIYYKNGITVSCKSLSNMFTKLKLTF